MTEKKKTVMIVDDEPAMCAILKRIISGEGYRTISARDGEEALTLFTRYNPDVVLLDLMMPGISGLDVCRKIRQFSPGVHVIYLSAKVTPTPPWEESDPLARADAFLSKPATSVKILSTIRKVLRNTSS
jgi:two-component system, OmpR family, response regulator MtrA